MAETEDQYVTRQFNSHEKSTMYMDTIRNMNASSTSFVKKVKAVHPWMKHLINPLWIIFLIFLLSSILKLRHEWVPIILIILLTGALVFACISSKILV